MIHFSNETSFQICMKVKVVLAQHPIPGETRWGKKAGETSIVPIYLYHCQYADTKGILSLLHRMYAIKSRKEMDWNVGDQITNVLCVPSNPPCL